MNIYTGCPHRCYYCPSNINWAKFGREVEAACKEMGLDYYIKDSLRAEMDKL